MFLLLWNALTPSRLWECVFAVCFHEIRVVELLKVMGVNVSRLLFGNTALIINISALV